LAFQPLNQAKSLESSDLILNTIVEEAPKQEKEQPKKRSRIEKTVEQRQKKIQSNLATAGKKTQDQ